MNYNMVSIFSAKRWSQDWWAQLFLTILWGIALLGYVRGIINHLPILNNFTDQIEIAIVVIPMLFSLPYFLKHLKIADCVFLLIWIIIYLLSYFNVNNTEFLNSYAYTFLCTVLPFYLVGRFFDFNALFRPCVIISAGLILLTCFYSFSYAQSSTVGTDTSEYNMSASYKILQHVILILYVTLKSPKWWNVIISILGVFLILSYGTRGPLGCCILFIVGYLIFFKTFRHKGIVMIFLSGLVVVLLKFINEIMMGFQLLLLNMNMSTRIVDKFLNDELENSSGRDLIHSTLWNIMKEDNNIGGYGICGSWYYVGTYPHNIITDFFFTFGYILALLLLILLSYIIVKALATKDVNAKGFIFVLTCSSVVKLFFSGTFIQEPILFFLIGYCITQMATKNEF